MQSDITSQAVLTSYKLLEIERPIIGNSHQAFKNGHEFAAWLGLVPRQHSTGGKPLLLGISKRGDRYLQKLLIHGARAVVRTVDGKQDGRSRWLQGLIGRRGKNRAGVAQANKTARIAWVLLAKGERYRPAA
jgi:transposase